VYANSEDFGRAAKETRLASNTRPRAFQLLTLLLAVAEQALLDLAELAQPDEETRAVDECSNAVRRF
jgi:hypothetical protein